MTIPSYFKVFVYIINVGTTNTISQLYFIDPFLAENFILRSFIVFVALLNLRFAVREIYPSDRGKQCTNIPSKQEIEEIFQTAKPDDTLKKILNPHLGTAIILICFIFISC